MKLCINYDLLWEEAYNFIFQFKLLELLVDDINDVSIFVKFHQFPQSVSVETEQLQLVFFLSHFTIPLPFHSSFILLLLLFKSFLPLVISFSKLSPILHQGLAGVQGLNVDWQTSPGVPSSHIVKRTLRLDIANDSYPNVRRYVEHFNAFCCILMKIYTMHCSNSFMVLY